ncbi:carboxypeptidase-like regulatory domain-containing protein [Parapedobacter sp. 2B3]
MEKGNVDMELIRRYVRGELTPREMYALERQAQTDPMLMDIILGMEQEAPHVHSDNLADIRKRIAERAAQPRTSSRRLAPAQRWAIAASVLAVLTVGTWWFTRENTLPERESVAASSKEIRQEAAPEIAPSTEPGPSPAEREASAAPQQLRTAPSTAAASREQEDSVVVVGYGTQRKSAVVGAVTRLAAKENDTPFIVGDQALASRTDGIRIRGIGIPRHAVHPQPIIGKVVDETTHEPLAGVTIQVTDEHTVATDKLGRFMALDTSQTLTARYIGYETQTVRIDGRDSVTIALRPNETGLSEVVVVGYGQRRRRTEAENVEHTESKPIPKDGWDAYRRYLKDAMKLAQGQEGTVHLVFTVDDEGRPTAIKVTETTNNKLNAFATLVVRDGPRWLPGANGERTATLQLTF